MQSPILYRHWQPGDADALCELLSVSPWTHQMGENYPPKQPDTLSLGTDGIRLAIVNQRVVGHVLGSSVSLFIADKLQNFGIVALMFVIPEMRRQGIATRLMQELHEIFERKGYRGSILHTDTDTAAQVYRKLGYRQVTRALQSQISPSRISSALKWTEAKLEDLNTLNQISERWARQHFMIWDNQRKVNRFNMKQYRVLRSRGRIVGYAKWYEVSQRRPHGLICDPIAPDEDPMAVIRSVQSAIPAQRAWETSEGSRYVPHLCSLGYPMALTTKVDMLLSFGQDIDLPRRDLTSFFW